jgi:hypothetical protein
LIDSFIHIFIQAAVTCLINDPAAALRV